MADLSSKWGESSPSFFSLLKCLLLVWGLPRSQSFPQPTHGASSAAVAKPPYFSLVPSAEKILRETPALVPPYTAGVPVAKYLQVGCSPAPLSV